MIAAMQVRLTDHDEHLKKYSWWYITKHKYQKKKEHIE